MLLLAEHELPNQQRVHPIQGWHQEFLRQISIIKHLNEDQDLGFMSSELPKLDQAEEFIPNTFSEKLLIAIYLDGKGCKTGIQRTFDMLWDLAEVPFYFKKLRANYLNSSSDCLKLADGIEHNPGIKVIGFDPYAYCEDISQFVNDSAVWLAHSEVLSANIMFENWIMQCNGIKIPFPVMAGYKFIGKSGDWQETIRIQHWKNDDDQKEFCMYSIPYNGSNYWSTPIARRFAA